MNRDYVLLENGDILPYIKGKDYGHFVLRVWTAEKDFIRPMTKEERRRSIERGLINNQGGQYEFG
jgi:hypothetical protein